MLVDRLQERFEALQVVEPDEFSSFQIIDLRPSLMVEGSTYQFSEDALFSLLNEIRLPIKYFERLVEKGENFLAELNVNNWLKETEMKYVSENDVLIKAFSGNRLYVPAIVINDAIVDHLEDVEVTEYEITKDGFSATYISSKAMEVDKYTFRVGIRVLYSECFTITPRFDAFLYSEEDNLVLSFSASNRKFRSAGTNINRVLEQTREFIDLAIEETTEALEGFRFSTRAETYSDIVRVLCAELRLARAIKGYLMVGDMGQTNIVDIMAGINMVLSKDNIDLAIGRDIQVAMTNYALTGVFK